MDNPRRRRAIKNLDHVVSTSIKEDNKVNEVVDNILDLFSNSILARNEIRDSQPKVNFSLGGRKGYVKTVVSILT